VTTPAARHQRGVARAEQSLQTTTRESHRITLARSYAAGAHCGSCLHWQDIRRLSNSAALMR
jgi:hypothetical protein